MNLLWNTLNKDNGKLLLDKKKKSRLMILSVCALCAVSAFIKNKELSNNYFKMNKVINNFLLTGDKFMPEQHLKQPRFTYSPCGPFAKHYERIQKFRETGKLKQLYRNELHKACFAHDTAYSDSKDLVKRTISDKILKDSAYQIARIVDMMDIKEH